MQAFKSSFRLWQTGEAAPPPPIALLVANAKCQPVQQVVRLAFGTRDTIVYEAFAHNSVAYVLDDCFTTPVLESTLDQLYSSGTATNNPFTGDRLRKIAKVAIELEPVRPLSSAVFATDEGVGGEVAEQGDEENPEEIARREETALENVRRRAVLRLYTESC